MNRRGGRAGWGWRRSGFSAVTKGGLAALALALTAQARHETFSLITAERAVHVEEDHGYHAVLTGATAGTPARFRTRHEGLLHLANPSLQLELQGLSDLTIETNFLSQETGYQGRFLKTSPLKHGPSSVAHYQLNLHRGSVFIQASEKAVSVYAGEVRVDAKNAVFALSTSSFLGQHVSVIHGLLKVRNADQSISLVPAGQTLHTGTNIAPALVPLQEHPSAEALQNGLTAFRQNARLAQPKAIGDSPSVLEPKEPAFFKLHTPQNAALLEAPSEDKIGSLKVSVDLNSPPPH